MFLTAVSSSTVLAWRAEHGSGFSYCMLCLACECVPCLHCASPQSLQHPCEASSRCTTPDGELDTPYPSPLILGTPPVPPDRFSQLPGGEINKAVCFPLSWHLKVPPGAELKLVFTWQRCIRSSHCWLGSLQVTWNFSLDFGVQTIYPPAPRPPPVSASSGLSVAVSR